MIRVCLVEDQTLVRQGIRSLLELADEVTVVAEAGDGEAALGCIEQSRPDVLLLDIRMPKLDGIGVLKALANATYFPPTLILTTFDDDALVLQGLQAGARGYLLKDVSLEHLVGAIKTLHEGKTLIHPGITDRLLRNLPQARSDHADFAALIALTGRETEILRLMAGGYSNKEIGRALNLSEGTVKNHVSSILSKMGVRDRTRAVLKGLEQGLV